MGSDDMAAELMGADTMAMVFFSNMTTPLWSWSWRPKNASEYAGTCIFLIAFAIIYRFLLAFRSVVFDHNKNLVSHTYLAELEKKDSLGAKQIRPPQIGNVRQLLRESSERTPFKVIREAGRALLEVVIVGISYLLMLAVMTMNVGYFLSILAGVFVGTFAVGRLGGSGH
ncbi:Ctr copper transporter [Xylariaceae sp. FL1272]|nr:Ctr copper transporter [Xylariaceae sp. FL1272]